MRDTFRVILQRAAVLRVTGHETLLADNPEPSDEAINQHMSGNICRCGTYNRIKAAIKDAGKAMGGAS